MVANLLNRGHINVPWSDIMITKTVLAAFETFQSIASEMGTRHGGKSTRKDTPRCDRRILHKENTLCGPVNRFCVVPYGSLLFLLIIWYWSG